MRRSAVEAEATPTAMADDASHHDEDIDELRTRMCEFESKAIAFEEVTDFCIY